MNTVEEQELRNRAADLVLAWYSETRGSLGEAGAEEFLELVEAAQIGVVEANHSLQRWVDTGRRAGLTWAELGEALGMTRQAAQKRFGQGAEPSTAALPKSDDSGLLVRTGVNAFNEIGILAEEGEAGRELVGGGFLTLTFRETEQRWEHARVVSLRRGRVRESMEADGWQHCLTWPPFQYFKRPLAG